MKTVIGIVALLAGVLIGSQWGKASRWIMTVNPPATHPDSKPRFRRWENGVEVEWNG